MSHAAAGCKLAVWLASLESVGALWRASGRRFADEAASGAVVLGMGTGGWVVVAKETRVRWERGGDVGFEIVSCSLGLALVAVRDGAVCAIELGDDEDQLVASLAARFAGCRLVPASDEERRAVAAVERFLDGGSSQLDVQLDAGGTGFQQLVWRELCRIPAGETRTYAEVAAAIGRPSAMRAVASACGANRLAIAIPCHRVVRSDGSLSGYRWGVERKRMLLERERSSVGEDGRERVGEDAPAA